MREYSPISDSDKLIIKALFGRLIVRQDPRSLRSASREYTNYCENIAECNAHTSSTRIEVAVVCRHTMYVHRPTNVEIRVENLAQQSPCGQEVLLRTYEYDIPRILCGLGSSEGCCSHQKVGENAVVHPDFF